MLKTLMTEERLKELFVEVQKGTDNFTDFSPKVLMENSNRLIVFRLALGMSLKKFSKLFNLHLDTISQHERIKGKTMKLVVAEKFMRVIKKEVESRNLVGQVGLDVVLSNFNKFKDMLKGGFISPENLQVFNSLPLEIRRKSIMKGVVNSFTNRKLTTLEEKVFKHLRMKNINVTPHFMIGTKEIDLAIWNNNKLSLLIEVIQESFFPLKIIKLRDKIKSSIICIVSKDRKRDVIALNKVFDAVFFEDELNELVKFIKNSNRERKHFSIEPFKFRELDKMDNLEERIWEELKKISNGCKSQLKFLFRVNGKVCSKTIDFALPGIFIEVKSCKDLEFQINRAAVESLFFKTVFPDFRFFVLLESSNENDISKNKLLSLPLKSVGIDKLFFSTSDMLNEIKSAEKESFAH